MGFLSMLPEDSAARKVAALEAIAKIQQGRVDEHLETVKPGDRPTPYSDSTFQDAAIQWLIQTDQVGSCLFFVQLYSSNVRKKANSGTGTSDIQEHGPNCFTSNP